MGTKKVKGINIELGGDTTKLNKAMSDANKTIYNTQKELKEVEKALKLDPGNTELIAQKQELLAKNIDATKKKMKLLQDVKTEADKIMADGTEVNAEGYRKLVREITKAEKSVEKLTDEVEHLNDTAEDTEDATDKMTDGFSIAKGAISGFIVDGVQALISKTKELVEETREYREDMNKLQVAFESGGHSVDTAKKTYSEFYKILGESDRSVEAVNHLARFVKEEKDLAKWGNIAAGVTATFGDSLPIEGLTEAANETAKVGKVTGVLADALNWVGIAEDDFNAKLEKCRSEQERSVLVTDTLNQAYETSGLRYKEINADIIANRESTEKLQAAQVAFAEKLEPVMQTCQNVIADFAMSAAENLGIVESEHQKVINKVNEQADAYYSAKQAIYDNTVEQLAQVESTKMLYEELEELVDETGNVDEANRNRAEYIINELNSALGIELALNQDLKDSLEQLGLSIDEVIEKRRAQILLEANEEEYVAALEAKNDAIKAQEDALAALIEAEENYKAHGGTGDFVHLEKMRTAYQEATAVVTDCNETIVKHENATAAALEGNTEKVIEILSNEGQAFEDAKSVATKSKEEQQQILGQQYYNMLIAAQVAAENYNAVQSDANKKALEEAMQHAENARVEYEKVGGAVVDGTIKGLDGKELNLKSRLDTLFAKVPDWAKKILGINSPAKKLIPVGEAVPEGVVVGVENKESELYSTLESMAEGMKETLTGKAAFDITDRSEWAVKMGEYLVNGLAEGIEEDDSAEEALEKKLKNLKTITSNIQNDINTDYKLADKEFEFWKLRNPDATEEELNEMELKMLTMQYEDQASAVDVVNQAYEKSVELSGENSKSSKNFRLQLIEEKIALEELADAIEKVNEKRSNFNGSSESKSSRSASAGANTSRAMAAESYYKWLAANQSLLENQGLTTEQITAAAQSITGFTPITTQKTENNKNVVVNINQEINNPTTDTAYEIKKETEKAVNDMIFVGGVL